MSRGRSREYARTVGAVSCPKCRRTGEAHAAPHDFGGREGIALLCPPCRHIWKAPVDTEVRNPDGSTHRITGTDADHAAVRAYGP